MIPIKNKKGNLNLQKNKAFEIAIQKQNFGVAENILRDLSLENAIKKEEKTLLDPNSIRFL